MEYKDDGKERGNSYILSFAISLFPSALFEETEDEKMEKTRE